jgi:hypothetical protein
VCDADHSPSANTEVKKMRIYISTSSIHLHGVVKKRGDIEVLNVSEIVVNFRTDGALGSGCCNNLNILKEEKRS